MSFTEAVRKGAPALAALLVLGSLHVVQQMMIGDPLSVGSDGVQLSGPMSRFLSYYLIFGGLSVVLLTWGLFRLFPRGAEQLGRRLGQGSDRTFVLAASLLAFAVASLVHQYLLGSMPLADDEAAYRYSAQILGEGRLWLPSDPDKDFFDRLFLVNDGKQYTQYFLGWPAMLLPFLLAGLAGLANPAYFALTVPAVFLILRRLSSPLWARAGALLLIASPMLSITAGTLLSHTSCTLALAWFLYCALRCREANAAWYWHAALAATFCTAFVNRPLTALGLGLPVLLSWLFGLRRSGTRGRDLLAFVLPAAAAAGLFLLLNAEQTGHPLRTAYGTYYAYTHGIRDLESGTGEISFVSASHSFLIATTTFLRLNFSLFGWPCSWLFVAFAGALPFRRLLLATVVTFLAANLFTTAIGFDTYAPMHFIEIGLPLVLLTALGLEQATAWARSLERRLADGADGGPGRQLAGIPALAAASSLIVAVLFFLPYQALAVWKSANMEKLYRAGVEELPKPAVIFVKDPYARQDCYGGMPISWVRTHPFNHPNLEDDYLWLDHLDIARDRDLMARRFPDRKGFIATWDRSSCVRIWLPLDSPAASIMPADSNNMFNEAAQALRGSSRKGS
jgi:hypothetical protein